MTKKKTPDKSSPAKCPGCVALERRLAIWTKRAREAEEDRAELKNEMKELEATHRRELREARDREPEVEPGPPKDLTPPPEAGVATSPPPDATQSPPDLAPPTP